MSKILFRASGVGALMTDPKSKKDKESGVLSATAKIFIQDLWLQNEIGFHESLKNKFVEKGLSCEEDSITLFSKVTGKFFRKNEERKDNGVVTGECDLLGDNEIIDIKTSWNAKTFMNGGLSTLYEWQLRVYMELWDVDNATLAYCLVDAPDGLVLSEQQRVFYQYQNIDEDFHVDEIKVKSYDAKISQIKHNLVISDRVNESQRVKFFTVKRDKTKMEELYSRIENAVKFYKTIELNNQ